ncbi:PREDICTED: uncharacterized protein LOC108771892 [Cyphomyrmex costatus]|uniref:uncharacterized protein LOC108771892 n=1 Tax=Cyphomyrmex costatus TaxID=456900 RepID=UPI0008522F07|nr:PREDICTED: uncharacterized protein LOC108771892 [Cyphomyrmex costatus]
MAQNGSDQMTTSQQTRERDLLWFVVEFEQQLEDSTTVEVVPSTWVTILENITTCKWPPKNSRKAIKKRIPPSDSWETWTIVNILLKIETSVDRRLPVCCGYYKCVFHISTNFDPFTPPLNFPSSLFFPVFHLTDNYQYAVDFKLAEGNEG